jgi:hypothetical protein
MNITNKINSLDIVKTLKIDRVGFTVLLALITTLFYSVSTELNNVNLIHIIAPAIISIAYFLTLKNTANSIAEFCMKYSNLILIMIVVTVFQTMSVFTYSEAKMLIPESVQALVLMVIPMFKWSVFIYVLNKKINN